MPYKKAYIGAIRFLESRVADPHHWNGMDPAFHFNVDPGPDPDPAPHQSDVFVHWFIDPLGLLEPPGLHCERCILSL